MVRTFEYKNPITNKSSLFIHGDVYTKCRIVPIDSRFAVTKATDHYTCQPSLPLSYTEGSPVLYQEVTEYSGYPDDCTGKTEYHYMHAANDTQFFFNNGDYGINGHYTIPSIPYLKILPRFRYYHNDMGWLRGHLKQMNTYKKDGDKFTLVKSIENNYKEFDKHQFIVGFNVFRLVEKHPDLPEELSDQKGRAPWPPEAMISMSLLPPVTKTRKRIISVA